MNAQYNKGKPNDYDETYDDRLFWFQQCLNEISSIKDLKSIAFPYLIGCGMAGGEWNDYLEIIQNFANQIPEV